MRICRRLQSQTCSTWRLCARGMPACLGSPASCTLVRATRELHRADSFVAKSTNLAKNRNIVLHILLSSILTASASQALIPF